jgi:hypothetical protein
MKKVIVFQKDFYKDRVIYVLNEEKTFYESLSEPGVGFSVETTTKYPHGFNFFDTVEEADMFIREKVSGVVVKEDADVFCPKCARGYEASDNSEDEHVWVYTVSCACGHDFKVEGRQITLYTVLPD